MLKSTSGKLDLQNLFNCKSSVFLVKKTCSCTQNFFNKCEAQRAIRTCASKERTKEGREDVQEKEEKMKACLSFLSLRIPPSSFFLSPLYSPLHSLIFRCVHS
ncbi:hypothetical protein KP509_15G023200 [Ceratopteris richardii]|uniref:Uncharacterized protein n=1 Tax=Ceratopteris richardii TaxID=49495 RepID=A0A8T2T1T5_CERRI|nr:hypothetical protein KP509_15G023200 [Ceratopteris richardii]